MNSEEMPMYWYNQVSGEVEEGPNSLAMDRLGPFKTAEEASRAIQIIRERAEVLRLEDEQKWRDG